MHVTTIVPTHNRAHYLGQSLDSVLGQTRPPDEVIVVDDGSTDDTERVLDGYRDRVRVITKGNGGKATALNLAIPAASGDLIWIFDDDDVAMADALARHVEVHMAHPEAGYTYSAGVALQTDADGAERVGEVIPIPDLTRHGVFYNLQRGCAINQQGTVVRRHCFDAVGPFNEVLQRTQDYDFLLRLARRFDGVRLDAPTFYFRHHEGPRGGAAARHGATDRTAQFFAYEQHLWAGILPDLAPRELLPARIPMVPWTPAHAREAAVRRMMIAGRFGLHDAFTEAVAALARTSRGVGDLNARERASAWLALARPEAAAFAGRDAAFLTRVETRLGRAHVPEIAFQILRGAWHAHRVLAREGRSADARYAARICRHMLRAGAWRWLPRHALERVAPARGAQRAGAT